MYLNEYIVMSMRPYDPSLTPVHGMMSKAPAGAGRVREVVFDLKAWPRA